MTNKTIQNIFIMDREMDFERGNISLHTGQDVDSEKAIRYKNYYKVPSLEEEMVYSVEFEMDTSQKNKDLPEYEGYIYFYDENHIFLRNYPPLHFTDQFSPILFRCPEGAMYIRITIDHLESISSIPSPTIVSNHKSLKKLQGYSEISFFSRIKIQAVDTIDHINDPSLYSFTIDSEKSYYVTNYLLYDKFNMRFLVLKCTPIESPNSSYHVLDNFTITGFQTITTTEKQDRSFEVWFLNRSVAIPYTVSNLDLKPIDYLLSLPEQLSYHSRRDTLSITRKGTINPIVTDYIQDTDFHSTQYHIIDSRNLLCELSQIDEDEFIAIMDHSEGDSLYASTYTIPKSVTVENGDTYTIVQLGENLMKTISSKKPQYASYYLDALDFRESSVVTVEKNCCDGIHLHTIYFNTKTQDLSMTIKENAFSNNNLQVLEFPSNLSGVFKTESFTKNPFSLIFFENTNDSLIIQTSSNVFSTNGEQCSILCKSSTQKQHLLSSEALSEGQFTIFDGTYHYVSKENDTEYRDSVETYYIYRKENVSKNGMVLFEISLDSNQKSILPSEVTFVPYIVYVDILQPQNSFIGQISGTVENAFDSCTNLQKITFGFTSGESFTINSNVCTNCSNLSTVVLLNNLIWKGSKHFQNCTSLQGFPVSQIYPVIFESMFQNTNVVTMGGFLNEAVQSIQKSAFEGHQSLVLSIPPSVKEIQERAFYSSNSTQMAFVFFEATDALPTGFTFQKDSFLNSDGTYPILLVNNATIQKEIQDIASKYGIPLTVQISNMVTLKYDSSSDVYYREGNPYDQYVLDASTPNTVKFSGFRQKPSSTSIILPDMVCTKNEQGSIESTYKVSGAFQTAFSDEKASAITEVTFSSFTTELPALLFSNHKNIQTVHLPGIFTTIGEKCFLKSTIESILIDKDYSKTIDPFLILKDLALAEAVKFKGDNNFWRSVLYVGVLACTNTLVQDLHSLPSSAELCSFAFYNCTALTTLPAVFQPKRCGSQCFDSCINLTHSYRSSSDLTAYDKVLSPNCIVFNLDKNQTSIFGEAYPDGDLEDIITKEGYTMEIKSSGYIFNYCDKIEDYRIRTYTTPVVDGVFRNDSENVDAWIRFEYDAATFVNNGHTVPDGHAYKVFMGDKALSYHTIQMVPELYLIHTFYGFYTNYGEYLWDYQKLMGSATFEIPNHYHMFGTKVSFLTFTKENYFDDGSKNNLYAIQMLGNQGGCLYNTDPIDSIGTIPHALKITPGMHNTHPEIPLNCIVLYVNDPKPLTGDTYLNYIGVGEDVNKKPLLQQLYVPSTFTALDTMWIHDSMTTSSNTGGLVNWNDSTNNHTYYNSWYYVDGNAEKASLIFSPKGARSIGRGSWDRGKPSSKLYRGYEGSTIGILPNSMELGKRFSDGRNVSAGDTHNMYRTTKTGGLTTIYIPKGVNVLNKYFTCINDKTGNNNVKTFWVRCENPSGFSAHSSSFDSTDNSNSVHIYTRAQSIAQNIKDATGKKKIKYQVYENDSQYDIPIQNNQLTLTESKEYSIRMESYTQQWIPYEEWIQNTEQYTPFFRSVEKEKEYHLQNRTTSVIVRGEKMFFNIILKVSMDTSDIIVTSLVPEDEYLDLTRHPMARFYTKEKSGRIRKGYDLLINVFDTGCCQSNLLKILHFAYTATTIKTKAFVVPNLSHVMLNGDLRTLESASFVLSSPEVSIQNITLETKYKGSVQNYISKMETGFKTIVIPPTISNLAPDCFVSYKGIQNGVLQTEEDYSGLRKLISSVPQYLSIANGEPYMNKGYLCSEFHDLEWMKSTYDADFSDWDSDWVCDDQGFIYRISQTREGKKVAYLISNQFKFFYDHKEAENNTPELWDRMIEREYPQQTFFVPQYLVSVEQKENILYTVVGIEDNAFQNADYFQKIRIPSSVVYFGESLFQDCKQLKEVEYCCFFPEKTILQKKAFYMNNNATLTVYAPHTPTPHGVDGEIILENIFTEEYINPLHLRVKYQEDQHGLPIKLYNKEN